MKVLFAGAKERGAACLKALMAEGHEIVTVIAPPGSLGGLEGLARSASLSVTQPANINDPDVVSALKSRGSEVMVLAGYGQIIKREVIGVAPAGCFNLHAGKLPQYRGSSPLNWILINGEKEFGLSVIRVDEGVDTGDIVAERTFPVGSDDTIADLHRVANAAFPHMLVGVLRDLQSGHLQYKKQEESLAAYYPLRFPEDGLLVWDELTAQQIHDRIRALTDPYPGAFTLFQGRKVRILASRLEPRRFYGEAGRVYKKQDGQLFVCAKDRCLWITRAVFEETKEEAIALIPRYGRLSTLRALWEQGNGLRGR